MIAARHDLLVIGDGLAGSAAALEAARAGASVILVSAGAASSDRAQGGIAAATGEGDSPLLHSADTIAAGAGLCDPEAVDLLTAAGPETVRWLESLGVLFEGAAAREAAHSLPRVLHLGGDQSGRELMARVRVAIDAEPRIERLHGRLDRLLGAGWCAGAQMLDGTVVLAAATVVATGGYAGLYERTTNSRISSGKGLLEAVRIGAEAADLEFVQFHPTVYAGEGRPFLLTEALRGAGAWLVDANGRQFIDEMLPRDQVARAIALHDGPVYLSVAHLDRGVVEHFPAYIANARRNGLDPFVDPVPVAPGAHYTMGGIVTDLDGRTNVPGLYAAGECARTGVHGANRLASNSLLEAAAFGRRAAVAASNSRLVAVDGFVLAAARHDPQGEITAQQVRVLLDDAAGVLRNGRELEMAVAFLAAARGAGNLANDAIALARLICSAALDRTVSVGAHYRVDAAAAIAV